MRVRVEVDDDATERPAATLIAMAARTGLTVAEEALKAIAEVEGALHECPPPTSTCTNSAGTTPWSTSSAAPRRSPTWR